MVCAIAPQGLFHCQAKLRQPSALQSRFCVGSVIQASRSPPRSASLRRPSAAFCGGWAGLLLVWEPQKLTLLVLPVAVWQRDWLKSPPAKVR